MPEHTEVIVTPGIARISHKHCKHHPDNVTHNHTPHLLAVNQFLMQDASSSVMWYDQCDHHNTISYWPRAHNLLQHITQSPISWEQAWQLLSSLTRDDNSWPLIGQSREYWPLIGQCLMMMVWPYWGVMMSRLWVSWVIDRDKHDTILRLMDKQKWTHSVTNWEWRSLIIMETKSRWFDRSDRGTIPRD